MRKSVPQHLGILLADYGMVAVLAVLCAILSAATINRQYPEAAAAAKPVAKAVSERVPPGGRVILVGRGTEADQEFLLAAGDRLRAFGFTVAGTVSGDPRALVVELRRLEGLGEKLDAVATLHAVTKWGVLRDLPDRFPALGNPTIIAPEGRLWPTFLTRGNLLTVANRTVVIGIIAIGMTMVIITAGIDLSVGSLIALSSVVTGWLIRGAFGAQDAGAEGMILASVAGVLACGLLGLTSGAMVTFFQVPPFIVTLAMMLIASGLAFIIAGGESIPQVPQSFVWLGLGTTGGIPNAVLLTALLYAVAHVTMTRTPLGRYIYAVGGNREAARLSGVPVRAVILFVYSTCGLLAGLGGVILASKLRSGDPTLGRLAELDVIAAVVVGGTSLAGGEGKVLGTLVGALIIGVILNGMNLLGVESYTQKVVLGIVILAAVLLDRAKRKLLGGPAAN